MSNYLLNYFKTKSTLKFLGSTEKDKKIKKAFEILDELNKEVLATETGVRTYKEYNTSIQDLIKQRPEVVPDTIYKARTRLVKKLERVFYADLPLEVMEGDEDALAFVFYLYDTVQVTGKLEGNLLFGDVLDLSHDLLEKPDAVNITAGSFIHYAPELQFLKKYVQANYADSLFQLNLDRMGQLVHTLKDPTFNPHLYKLAVSYLLGDADGGE